MKQFQKNSKKRTTKKPCITLCSRDRYRFQTTAPFSLSLKQKKQKKV